MKSGSILAIVALIGAPIALVSASAQQGSPRPFLSDDPNRTPAGDIPPPWEIEFSLQDVARSTAGGVTTIRTTDYKGMKYSVRALPQMTVDPAHQIAGEFKQVTDAKGPKSHADQVLYGPPSARKTLPEPAWAAAGQKVLLLGRRIVEPTKCNGVLDVHTQGSRNMPSKGKANFFALSGNLNWSPTYWSSTVYMPPPQRTSTVPAMQDGGPTMTLPEFEVPYDFRPLTNNNGGAAYALPNYPVGGGFRLVKRTVNFTITRKPMWLEPAIPIVDLIGTPRLKCNREGEIQRQSKCVSVRPNYAVEEDLRGRWKSPYLHANIDIRLFIAGRDVTDVKVIEGGKEYTFNVLRILRTWRADISDNGVVGDTYHVEENVPAPRNFPHNWYEDPSAEGNFRDMPGTRPQGPPSKWGRGRQLQEFLLGVKDFPEFGFIYYTVTVDTMPGAYRVIQTEPVSMTAVDWCERFTEASTTPYKLPPATAEWVDRLPDFSVR